MVVQLEQKDFNTELFNMWDDLVEEAIRKKILPDDTMPEDVDQIEVSVVGAFTFEETCR